MLKLLAEIAPEVRHTVFKRTVREMRDAFLSGQAVKLGEGFKIIEGDRPDGPSGAQS